MVHVEEIGANGVDLEPDESSEGQESELPPGYSLSPFDDGGLDNEMAVLGRVPLAEVSVLDEIRRRAEVLEHDDDVFPATQLEEVYAVVSWQSESEFLSAVENSMTAVNIICPRLCEAHVSGPQLVLDLFHEAVIEGRFQSVVGFQENEPGLMKVRVREFADLDLLKAEFIVEVKAQADRKGKAISAAAEFVKSMEGEPFVSTADLTTSGAKRSAAGDETAEKKKSRLNEAEYDPDVYEKCLSSAMDSRSFLTLPWEEGWVGMVLNPKMPMLIPRPISVPEPEVRQAPVQEEAPIEVRPGIALKSRPPIRRNQRPWTAVAEAKKKKGLELWTDISLATGRSTLIGRELDSAVPEDRVDITTTWLGHKAASTLKSRGYSALEYMKWCASVEEQPYPITEALASAYADFERSRDAPPTRLRRFVQSMAFMKYVMNFQVDDEAIGCGKLHGTVNVLMKRKRPTKKARPFTVEMLTIFEKGTLPKFELKRRACGLLDPHEVEVWRPPVYQQRTKARWAPDLCRSKCTQDGSPESSRGHLAHDGQLQRGLRNRMGEALAGGEARKRA